MQLAHGLWLIVADGAKFLVLENRGDAAFPAFEVIGSEHAPNPPSRAQGTERPGRLADTPAYARSALEPTDWHRIGEERLARVLADKLEAWARAGRFAALIIAADPRTLGRLRPALGPETRARLNATLGRDLTGLPVPDIAAHLAAA